MGFNLRLIIVPTTIKQHNATAIRPVCIQNHCHPVGSCTITSGGLVSFFCNSLRMRVISSSRYPHRRRMLSQADSTIRLLSPSRPTCTDACPLRAVYRAPVGRRNTLSIGTLRLTRLPGIVSCHVSVFLTLCRLSHRADVRSAVRLFCPLQLAAHRAVAIMRAGNSLLNGAVKVAHRLV